MLVSCAFLLPALTSRAADRAAGPAVTIYSRDLGFVRETRTVELGAGHDTLQLADIPERIDVSSVRLTPAGAARVTRLAYRFDVPGGDDLLGHARGGRVRVTLRENRALEGTLITADGSWLVVRSDEGALLTLSRAAIDDVRFERPPSGLRLRPTLDVVLDGARPGRLELELAYLTGGLSWSAEHAVVRTGEGAATWSTAVAVQNATGRDYRDCRLKLVAGEPHRETPGPIPLAMTRAVEMSAVADKADFSEQAFSESHLYSLDRPATLLDRETQSLTMIEPHAVRVASRYLYRGGAPGVTAQLELQNTRADGLGVPLPAGRVRFYERDATGDLQFTGETRIPHTPEGEKLTLDVGTVFDIAAERREVASRRISDREREYQVEIKLRDRKKTDVTVVVEEPVPGDHEVVKKTHEFVRKDANTLQFQVPVRAGQEGVLGYTVRVRY
jgi:hypothetical protein